MSTFVQLQTSVFRELGEDSASPVYWTLAQVKAALNEGYSELSSITEFNETSSTLTTVANTAYYNLLTEFSKALIHSVTKIYHSSTKWLIPISAADLDTAAYIQWEKITGSAPTHFLLRGTHYLGLYPKPSAITTATVYYTTPPTDLSADADEPSFPADYHYLLEKYAVYVLLCQESEYLKAEPYYLEYVSGADALKKYMQQRAQHNLVPILGGLPQ